MQRFVSALAVVLFLLGATAAADVVIFTDGTRMQVQKYEIEKKNDTTRLDGSSGKSLPQIEIKLSSLVPYQISAGEHALTILFEGAESPPESVPVNTASDGAKDPAPLEELTESSSSNEPVSDVAMERPEVTSSELPQQHELKPQDASLEVPSVSSASSYVEPLQSTRTASFIDAVSHSISEGLLTVSVEADGRLNYTSFRLDEPSRLVFDFAGTLNRVEIGRIPIDAVGVYRVRVAQFQSVNPKITRIVFDLDSDIPHRAVSEGNDLKIYFSSSADRLAALGPPPASEGTVQITMVGNGGSVVITTMDGKLRSIQSNYINLDATQRLNPPRQSQQAQQTPPQPTWPPTPPDTQTPVEPVRPEPGQNSPSAPGRTIPKMSASDIPPPVWTNDELGVSLVVPSADWQVQDMVASFDVAVQLEKREGDARATLALIRRRMRSYKDFHKVIGEVESSVAAAPGFRFLGSGPLDLGPYTAYELRFIKQVAELPVYNRIIAYYSKDLVYLLSLACTESRRAENQDDFDALARRLVIKKPRGELTPKGKPKN